MTREIASAMLHLHSKNEIHGHLSSKCVLLDDNMAVKISDVGIRKIVAYAEVMMVDRMATAFSAPEVLSKGVAVKASDVYSFGVVVWHLAVRRPPFDGKDLESIRDLVCKKQQRLQLPANSGLPNGLLQLVRQCWKPNPEERPSFADIQLTLQQLS